jgi:hypothetical protein
MTKKTVITSEKREVWVIHHPSGKTTEHEAASNEAEAAASLIRLLDKECQSSPEGTDADDETLQKTRTANAE